MLTYNREAFVPRAIESILSQTFTDFEFIIIDNGSSDRSGVIGGEYAAKDNRVKVIHRERGNIGSGRNAGLDAAKGEYITFIDDDDWTEPDFLEFLCKLAADNGADIAICGSWRQFENGEIEPKYIFDELLLYDAEAAVTDMILRKHFNSGTPTKLFKRELFNTTPPPHSLRFSVQENYDDISTTYKLFANARLTAAHGEGKYYAVRHESNNSDTATKHQLLNPYQLNEYLSAFRERTEYLSVVLPNLTNLAKWSEWSYMISMIEKIKRYRLTNCNEPLEFMLRELSKNRDEFLNSAYTQDFEKEWMRQYLE